MKRFVMMSLLLVATAGLLLAQVTGSGTLTGPTSGSTVMVNTGKGLFALRAGVVAKYDFASLKLVKQLELFGNMPAAPTVDNTDRTASQAYYTALQVRMAPAIMIAKDSSLLIVIGDHFARISQETLKVEAKGDLSPAVKPAATTDTTGGRGGMRGGMGGFEAVPGYLLAGNVLCLMRSTEMLSVSITTGKVLARSALPKILQPQNPFAGMRGRNGGFGGFNGGAGDTGGGGRRGNRGGGQDNGGAAGGQENGGTGGGGQDNTGT